MNEQYRLFIDGKWQAPHDGQWLESTNPYTNEVWCQIPKATTPDVDAAVGAAKAAFVRWAGLHASERATWLHRLADKLEVHAEHLAKTEVKDNGKLFAEMRMQMAYLPKIYRYYAGLADKVVGQHVPIDKPNHLALTNYEPLGVVMAITAWNSPLLIMAWKIAPALAAGNTVVVKPSEFASASSFEFAKCVEEAGVPDGVINILSGLGADVGEAITSHPDIAKISLTGGGQTGAHVYSEAAKSLKHVTLELGGKSPNIVFADADQERAAAGVISGIFAASGQTCIAGSRALVHRKIADEFCERLVTIGKEARLGDPMNASTHIGPVTTPGQYQKILDYISIAKAEGAQCLLGGQAATGEQCGNSPWFVEPTIFRGVTNQMRIAREEVFGPILSVLTFEDDDEAIAIANDTEFGLAAGIWTTDMNRALMLPSRLQAGTVWVNTYRSLSVMLPFGGYKHSGIGRENGLNAMYEYLQEKTILVNCETGPVTNPFVMK